MYIHTYTYPARLSYLWAPSFKHTFQDAGIKLNVQNLGFPDLFLLLCPIRILYTYIYIYVCMCIYIYVHTCYPYYSIHAYTVHISVSVSLPIFVVYIVHNCYNLSNLLSLLVHPSIPPSLHLFLSLFLSLSLSRSISPSLSLSIYISLSFSPLFLSFCLLCVSPPPPTISLAACSLLSSLLLSLLCPCNQVHERWVAEAIRGCYSLGRGPEQCPLESKV